MTLHCGSFILKPQTMHRRGVGAGAIAKKKLAEAKYKERGTVLAEDQLVQMSKQLEMFKTNLEEFASKHKQEIRKNPQFRVQFQDMCATIGVDPLASGKGFWSEMLGVGDFYYELGVQIVEVCLALKHQNGGLITLAELHQQVLKGRGKLAQDVSPYVSISLIMGNNPLLFDGIFTDGMCHCRDDIIRAIKKLKVLGSGFGIIPVGGSYLVQSVPAELNMDHTVVLQFAEKKGYVTVSEIKASLNWESERAKHVLEHLLKEGLAWIDSQAPGEAQYWLPALFTELYSQQISPEETKGMIP
ncbi:vacuolar-sorting SNF8 isoform X1 [Pelobates cultripes]|uniref:Vacuolar-sorting protein SNF8 n=1 Tax=Pelobates cultripes TaxID=61616 RepID=A0AAD1SHU1_PELCU|nr:vacuolar-sorting SNF8 isoform X1 [Pelobates cultripes]